MAPFYTAVRNKLGLAVRAWKTTTANDSCASNVVGPWRRVWSPLEYDSFTEKYVLPKLIEVLQSFRINPAGQVLDQFIWVMSWATPIPIAGSAGSGGNSGSTNTESSSAGSGGGGGGVGAINLHQLMYSLCADGSWFSKWYNILYQWLNQSDEPHFEEISNWYQGWKNQFPKSVQDQETIKKAFSRGLDIIRSVVQAGADEDDSNPDPNAKSKALEAVYRGRETSVYAGARPT